MQIDTTSGAQAAVPEAVKTSGARRELKLSELVPDALVALLMLAFAIALWVGAAAFAPGPWQAQGAGTFPRSISLLLGMCSLLLLGRTLRAWRCSTQVASVEFRRPGAVATAMLLTVAYPPLIEGLGYYMATAAWLPVLLWVAGYRKLKGIVLVSLGFLLFSRIVFQHLLGTPMP